MTADEFYRILMSTIERPTTINDLFAYQTVTQEGWLHTQGERSMTHILFTNAIERLTVNIPAACKKLREQGYTSLPSQLERDNLHLIKWLQGQGEPMNNTTTQPPNPPDEPVIPTDDGCGDSGCVG